MRNLKLKAQSVYYPTNIKGAEDFNNFPVFNEKDNKKQLENTEKAKEEKNTIITKLEEDDNFIGNDKEITVSSLIRQEMDNALITPDSNLMKSQGTNEFVFGSDSTILKPLDDILSIPNTPIISLNDLNDNSDDFLMNNLINNKKKNDDKLQIESDMKNDGKGRNIQYRKKRGKKIMNNKKRKKTVEDEEDWKFFD
jgi:hypothetical protein